MCPFKAPKLSGTALTEVTVHSPHANEIDWNVEFPRRLSTLALIAPSPDVVISVSLLTHFRLRINFNGMEAEQVQVFVALLPIRILFTVPRFLRNRSPSVSDSSLVPGKGPRCAYYYFVIHCEHFWGCYLQ